MKNYPHDCTITGCSYPNCTCGKDLSNVVIPSNKLREAAEAVLEEYKFHSHQQVWTKFTIVDAMLDFHAQQLKEERWRIWNGLCGYIQEEPKPDLDLQMCSDKARDLIFNK